MIKENLDLLTTDAKKIQGVDLNQDLNKPIGPSNNIAVG